VGGGGRREAEKGREKGNNQQTTQKDRFINGNRGENGTPCCLIMNTLAQTVLEKGRRWKREFI